MIKRINVYSDSLKFCEETKFCLEKNFSLFYFNDMDFNDSDSENNSNLILIDCRIKGLNEKKLLKIKNPKEKLIILAGKKRDFKNLPNISETKTIKLINLPLSRRYLKKTISAYIDCHETICQNRILKSRYEILKTSFKTLINNLTFDFWAMDSQFRYVVQNSHSRKQWGNVIGKKIDALDISPDLKKSWEKESLRSYCGEVVKSQYMIREKEKNRFFESTIAPVKEDKKIVGIIGITCDITHLKKSQIDLAKKTRKLEDTNTALKVIINKRERDKKEIQENIIADINYLILPLFSSLKHDHRGAKALETIDEIEKTLNEIGSSLSKRLKKYNLTSAETQIASLIKHGKTTKEIAAILNVAKSTVDTHRNNIRTKMDLKKKKRTLKNFLSSIE